jgi:hypothetical protein
MEAHIVKEAGRRCPRRRLKASPFIPHKDAIRGFVLRHGDGQLNEAL